MMAYDVILKIGRIIMVAAIHVTARRLDLGDRIAALVSECDGQGHRRCEWSRRRSRVHRHDGQSEINV